MKHRLPSLPVSARNRSRAVLIFAAFLLFVSAIPALAETEASLAVLAETEPGGDAIDWFKFGMGLFGGLALFLFGMEQMSEGLKAAAGDTLKVLLSRLTKHRLMGALTGAFVMVSIGFLMLFIGKSENTRHYGSMVMGLGLVFYGMGVMGDAMLPLRSYPPGWHSPLAPT